MSSLIASGTSSHMFFFPMKHRTTSAAVLKIDAHQIKALLIVDVRVTTATMSKSTSHKNRIAAAFRTGPRDFSFLDKRLLGIFISFLMAKMIFPAYFCAYSANMWMQLSQTALPMDLSLKRMFSIYWSKFTPENPNISAFICLKCSRHSGEL